VNPFRIVAAGDSALVVEFEERSDPEVNARAVAMAERLHANPVAGVRDVVPTYRSVAVYFDPLRTAHDALVARLEREAAVPMPALRAAPDVLRLPVC
jgi:inhibitor of KinA